MTPRQTPWPRHWLMTDERLGDGLWSAIARLPNGDAGIVFRHRSLPQAERADLARRVAAICQRTNLVLALAGDCELAKQCGAQLVHNPDGPCALPLSLSVHSMEEALRARSLGPGLVFVSPIYPTRSHPGRTPLGPATATAIAKAAVAPAIALGGMNEERFAQLPVGVFSGWAGIDAWLGDPART